jgi:hypothetical protein
MSDGTNPRVTLGVILIVALAASPFLLALAAVLLEGRFW